MSIDIFIVSHVKDVEYLRYCLLSIRKFATGFRKTVVLVPDTDESPVKQVCDGEELKTFCQAPYPRGHLHHCVMKCCADEVSPGADMYLYLDSDCVIRERIAPDDYLVDGKPVLLVESYDSMRKSGNPAVCWQSGTAEVLGFTPTHECMRRHPAVHYGWTLSEFRNHVQSTHECKFLDYALSRNPDFPVGFNDFNNLGAFAHRFESHLYSIIDLTGHPERRPRDKLIQYWSHRALDKPQNGWLDGKIRSVVPIQEIKSILQIC